MTQQATDHVRPGRMSSGFNAAVAWCARRGISIYGSRELAVRGRSSGEWRTVPVNVLSVDGADYLLAPRGATQWVKNLRIAGRAELRLGREVRQIAATELTDPELRVRVLREYLRKWAWETGVFFPGLSKNSSAADLRAAIARYPVFAIAAA